MDGAGILRKYSKFFNSTSFDGRRYLNAVSLTQVERLAIMHFGEISIVAGRVNKKAGSYINDVYLAAAWMLQEGIRGNRTTWGNSSLISQIMW